MCTETFFKYGIFFSAWSTFFFGYFIRNSISPIVDVLEGDLNTTATGVGILGSFIHLFYFSPQIPYGILLQFVPGKYVMPISSLLLGVSCLLFSYSNNVTYATITLSLTGLSTAPAWLCFVRIIDDLFTRQQVPFAIGVQMLLTYSGLFLANYIQAQIYQTTNQWRIVFQMVAIGCWITGVLLFLFIYINDQRLKKLNPKALMKNGREVSMSAHELAQYKRSVSTDNDKTRLLSKNSSSSFNGEVKLSKKAKLAEMKTAFKRGFTLKLNWILSLWGYAGLSLVNGFIGLWFISYLMTKYGYERENSALISGSFYLMRAVSAPIYGRLAMKFSRRKIFLTVGSLLWICTLIIIYVFDSDIWIGAVIILNLISGVGAGSWGIMWALQREYNAYYNCKDMSAGLVNTIINASGFVTQLFIGEMLDIRWKIRGGEFDEEEGIRIYTTNDYQYALLILPVVILIAIISAMSLKETYGNNLDYSQFDKNKDENEDVTANGTTKG